MDNVNETLRGNTPGNITNGGLVAMQGQWIYFNSFRDGSYLLKKNLVSGKVMKVSEDSANYINIVGDWLYYTTKKGNHSIVKIRTDGSERTILADDQAEYMNVLKDRIYYCNFSDYVKLYTMHTDSTDRRLVEKNSYDSSFWLNAFDDWIYYLNEYVDIDEHEEDENEDIEQYRMAKGVYKIRPDGSQCMQLNNSNSADLNVSGEWVVYANADDCHAIYIMKTDGSEQTKLTDDSAFWLNVSGEAIYYCNASNKNTIYRIDLDGSNKTGLNDHYSSHIHLLSGWIYYYDLNHQLRKMQPDGSDNQLFY